MLAPATNDHGPMGLAAHPYEILYGASGYLTALLFLRARGFTAQEVPGAVVAKVARHIVEGGVEGPGCVYVVGGLGGGGWR